MAHCVFTWGKREGPKRELRQESKSGIRFETLVRRGRREGHARRARVGAALIRDDLILRGTFSRRMAHSL
jgi:hypothetical protein